MRCMAYGDVWNYQINDETKKAGKGNRTPLSSLGSWHSTDELYLQTMSLYTSDTKKSSVFFKFAGMVDKFF